MARQSQSSHLRDAGGVCSEIGAFLKMWAQMKRFGALFFIVLNNYNSMFRPIEVFCFYFITGW